MTNIVKVWNENLITDDKFIKSSINPISARGKQYNGINDFVKYEKMIVVITKESPPPEAVGLIWELLLLGLSIKKFEKKGTIIFNIEKEKKNEKIYKKMELLRDIILNDYS